MMKLTQELFGWWRWSYRILYGIAIAIAVLLLTNVLYDKWAARRETESARTWTSALAQARGATQSYLRQVQISRVLNDSITKADSAARRWRKIAGDRVAQLNQLPHPAPSDSTDPVWMHRDLIAEAALAAKDSALRNDSVAYDGVTRDRDHWRVTADTLRLALDTVVRAGTDRIALLSHPSCRVCPSRKVSAILGALAVIGVKLAFRR